MTDESEFLKALLSKRPSSLSVGGESHGFDENDLAVAGHLDRLPTGRESEFRAALAKDPLLNEAVAFGRSFVRKSRFGWMKVAAAAMLLIAVGIGTWLTSGSAKSPAVLIAEARYDDAIRSLESLDRDASQQELLVAARFARGDANPAEGLDQNSNAYGFLFPEETLVRSVAERDVNTQAAPRILFLGGYVKGARPQIRVRPDPAFSTRVLLYEAGSNAQVLETTLGAGTAFSILELPSDLQLKVLGRYGVELWSADGQRLDFREFQVADANLVARTEARVEEISGWFPRAETLRAAVQGNLYFHAGFYEAALSAYLQIADGDRSVVLRRLLDRLQQ
jgi:hypothetical protein